MIGRLVVQADDDSDDPLVGEVVGRPEWDDDEEYVFVAWGPARFQPDGSAAPVLEACDQLRPFQLRRRP